MLGRQLCKYYDERNLVDVDHLPKVTRKNVLILKYYSFENYFLEPSVMKKIGVIRSEEDFYNILYKKYKDYLFKLNSFKKLLRTKNFRIKNKQDIKDHIEDIKIYVRGHNLFDIFYGRYHGTAEQEILKKYIDVAPRETFQDIFDAIDSFVYFENRKKWWQQKQPYRMETNFCHFCVTNLFSCWHNISFVYNIVMCCFLLIFTKGRKHIRQLRQNAEVFAKKTYSSSATQYILCARIAIKCILNYNSEILILTYQTGLTDII